ncbi:MAG: TatA/E family twin arginine-targeting protein translocase [Slackia sp.]|nr:TatA/E family twin arginine-targeting protein translocase [Slackia sp.]
MKIFGLGMPELLIILGVALLIFGPKHLPKLGSALGKTIKNLRDGFNSGDGMIKKTSEETEEEAPKRKKKAPKRIEAAQEEASAADEEEVVAAS